MLSKRNRLFETTLLQISAADAADLTENCHSPSGYWPPPEREDSHQGEGTCSLLLLLGLQLQPGRSQSHLTKEYSVLVNKKQSCYYSSLSYWLAAPLTGPYFYTLLLFPKSLD